MKILWKIFVNSILSFFAVLLMSIIPALALYMILIVFNKDVPIIPYIILVLSADMFIAIYWGYNLSIYNELDELMDAFDGIKEEDNDGR